MRNIYKLTTIKEDCYLYPYPVIKDKKYLIKIDKVFSEFYSYALEKKFLDSFDSFDSNLEKLTFIGIHTDNKTKIYCLVINKLKFNLLINKQNDLAKTENIENILTKKIISCLNCELESVEKLVKTYENQKKCKTCISLGILNTDLVKLIEFLIYK